MRGFTGIFGSRGKGSGVAIYYNSDKLSLSNWKAKCNDEFQAIYADFIFFHIIAVYRSPRVSNSARNVFEALKPLLIKKKQIFVVGDFNLSPVSSPFAAAMQGLGYKQLINKPTHALGNILDHLYTNDLISLHDVTLQPVYFSDHDAVGGAFKLDQDT